MIKLILAILLLLSSAPISVASQKLPEVKVYGSLRAMMHDGQITPVINTAEVTPGPSTYGVGALSELRGEITIVNDRAWFSYPDGKGGFRTEVGASGAESATLLVVAKVQNWEEITIGEELTMAALETLLSELAKTRSFSEESSFPFQITGLFSSLDLHIIDGSKLRPGDTPQQHRAAAVNIPLTHVAATLIGFYSTAHEGIFTHRGKFAHVHAIAADPLISAHVDEANVPKGAILKLPR